MDRYPMSGMDRYPPPPGPPGGDYPYPMPADHRYPMMPGGGGYPPSRYPMMPPSGGGGGYSYIPRPGMGSGIPDDSKYPPPPNNAYPDDGYSGNRDPYGNKDRYNPDGMYPDTRNPPSRGKPYEPPPYSVRYPEGMDRYPTMPMSGYGGYSENRFPVGSDRFPTNIYKYGNRDRIMPSGGYMPMGPPVDMIDRGYPSPPRGYSPSGYPSPNAIGGGRPGAGPPYIMVGWGGGVPTPVSDPSMYGMPYGPGRPISAGTRCDDVDSYRQMGLRQKMKKQFVRRAVRVPTLTSCQRECTSAADFVCRSFNYREEGERGGAGDTFNCELSDRDLRELDLNNPQMFETSNYDFYERSLGGRSNDGDCLDVSQTCNEDGMEFTLRTNEPFTGRIYSYGFYDR
jgi:hypothetical protein